MNILSKLQIEFLQFSALICIILTTVFASEKPQNDQKSIQMVSIKLCGAPQLCHYQKNLHLNPLLLFLDHFVVPYLQKSGQ